jgi:UDP-N-acetylmuramoyl-tripeptide--D-alanyl-D-alanine ligase
MDDKAVITGKPLWTAQDFCQAVNGDKPHPDLPDITGISIDTRTLQAGEAYFAIQGVSMDGHRFVQEALSKGASCAVVRKDWANEHEEMADRLVVVADDPLEGMNRLARVARQRMKGKVIAITGSVGKTGTRRTLAHVLARFGKVHASEKSYNNHWGVPLCLSRMPADYDFGVFEIGMNHAGEITPLSRMVAPHIAIITTVAAVHLEFFESVWGIAAAKAEIFEGLVPGGMAIVHGDIEYTAFLKEQADQHGAGQVITFGEQPGNDIVLESWNSNSHTITGRIKLAGESFWVKLGVPGKHHLLNSLSILGVVNALDLDLTQALMALQSISAGEGRGQRIELKTGAEPLVIIDESYNANPTSMVAALEVLGQIKPKGQGRRIAVLGDMLELGNNADEFHIHLKPTILAAQIAKVFCVGSHMAQLYQALPGALRGGHSLKSADLAPKLVSILKPGDVVMIKGSLGSRICRIIVRLRLERSFHVL